MKMNPKDRKTEPDSYAEFVKSHDGRMVRLYLSNGEKREGVARVHGDYVTFEEQFGGYPMAHIVGLVPLSAGALDPSDTRLRADAKRREGDHHG
jgi:hypothetical protein